MRRLAVVLLLLAAPAARAQSYVQNDNFTGSGNVNTGIDFLPDAYQGPGVILTPAPDQYPVTILAIDALVVGFDNSGDGQEAAYLVDVWTMADGGFFTGPPDNSDGNVIAMGSFQVTTSSTQFNEIPLATPLVLTSGNLFVEIQDEQDSEDDGTTVAMDLGPQVPNVNFYYEGGLKNITDAGAPYTGNWIVRARLQTPAASSSTSSSSSGSSGMVATAATVSSAAAATSSAAAATSASTGGSSGTETSAGATSTSSGGENSTSTTSSAASSSAASSGGTAGTTGGESGTTTGGTSTASASGAATTSSSGAGTLALTAIDPTSGPTNADTPVTIEGSGFVLGVVVLVGPDPVNDLSARSDSVLSATVPSGIAPGAYDVVAVNPDGSRAVLPKAFTVTAATPTSGGSSGSSGSTGTTGAPAKGCGCTGGGSGDALAGLLIFGALRRRRAPRA